MFRGILAAASVAALAMLGGATAANASTSVLPFNHSVVVNANGTDFFQASDASVNAAVNAGPGNSVDDNFVVLSSGPNSVKFALMGSNLCVADPGSGYGAVDAVVLRTCNGRQWQAFRVLPQGGNLNALKSVATNQYVQDNGQFNGLTTNADNRPCTVGVACPSTVTGANTFDTTKTSQEWRFGNFFRPFRHVTATETQSLTNGGNLLTDSVNYMVDVQNHGNVGVTNLVVHEDVTAEAEVTYNGNTYVGSDNLGDQATSGYLNVVGAHSHQAVPGVVDETDLPIQTVFVSAADPGHDLVLVRTAPHVYEWRYGVPAGETHALVAHPIVFHSATFTETPSVHVNFGAHVQNVNVTPQQEVTSF